MKSAARLAAMTVPTVDLRPATLRPCNSPSPRISATHRNSLSTAASRPRRGSPSSMPVPSVYLRPTTRRPKLPRFPTPQTPHSSRCKRKIREKVVAVFKKTVLSKKNSRATVSPYPLKQELPLKISQNSCRRTTVRENVRQGNTLICSIK